jgi:prepilin-type N-terminal cleavage/methylation domain-containing protein
MTATSNKGFSLIEVLASIVLFAIVIAGGAVVMGELHESLTANRRSEELSQSIQEFKEWIENPAPCKELIKPLTTQGWKPIDQFRFKNSLLNLSLNDSMKAF